MKILQTLLIYLPPFILAVFGLVRYEQGTHYPTYTNPAAVEQLKSADYGDSDKYYKELAKYETSRNELMDTGAGFAALGLSTIMMLLLFRIKTMADIAAIGSPRSFPLFLILMNLSLLAEVLVELEYIQRTFERGDYPPWADSIGIPMMGTVIMFSIQAMATNPYLVSIRKQCRFPARLFQKKPVTFNDFVVAFFVAVLLFSLYNSTLDGAFLMVPFQLTLIYLALSLRGAYSPTAYPPKVEIVGCGDSEHHPTSH